MDPNITTPISLLWSIGVERQLTRNLVAEIEYEGQHSQNLLISQGVEFQNTYGTDVNVFAGDLMQNPACAPTVGQTVVCDAVPPTRLNHSFGEIQYNYNGGRSNYSGIIFALRGRFGAHGFLTASYTHGRSYDDTSTAYPSEYPIDRWYGPASENVPNRLSFGADYNLGNAVHHGRGFLGRLGSGYGLSGDTILESGMPFSVVATNPFDAESVNGGPLQFLPDSGDFNADGDAAALGNEGEIGIDSYPNVSSYHISRSRKSWINGIFPQCAGTNLDNCGPFTFPTMGTEGNEKINQFENPGMAEVDVTLRKVTRIHKGITLELRTDWFNVFNRVNLGGVDNGGNDGPTFGRVLSTYSPRIGQVAAKVYF